VRPRPSHAANRAVLTMTIASFFAMLAAFITRITLWSGMFGGFGGGNRANNNGPPIWLIVLFVSRAVYAISFVLIRTLSRYREYAADRGSAVITGAPEYLMSALQKISSQMTLIPQQDLRQVEGMNAFFIIPAKARTMASELFMDHPPGEPPHDGFGPLQGPPADREAPRGTRRDRPRDGSPRQLRWDSETPSS